MKILVTVKEVAEPEDDFEISGNDIDEKFLEYDLNEWDDYAVEEAVQIKEESDDDVEVVSVTVGPERSEETIRMALAKGADRAVRVWDDALEDGEVLDPNAKAKVLAGVVEEEDPDLIFTGVQSGDVSLGGTGVALADQIGFEWAAVVNAFDFDADEGVAHVHRELEGGVEEVTEVEAPAVFTIQTGINEPRYASLRGIRQAQSKEIAPKTLDDLGLTSDDIETPIQLTEMYEPESESDTDYIEGGAEEQASRLVEIFEDKGVV
ncbi:MAG: electron transfer flavoprotein subunit beta/FixA family protein [Halobacteria archaeon]|nr:electron transfer flavoprotein subunit beta/FixA family protein [Halobacteria archaeon]